MHNLCKLSDFVTAGDISDNIFQGGRIVSEEFVKISLIYKEPYSDIKSLVYTLYILPCLNVSLNITSSQQYNIVF